jgi:predicted nucleic acid-binding Zn ribbon protein
VNELELKLDRFGVPIKPRGICPVCGARARGQFETCDPVCTRALGEGRSRGEQVEAEILEEWSKPALVAGNWMRIGNPFLYDLDKY